MSTKTLQRLLKKRLRESGLSTKRFAAEVMVRDEGTIRRWLAGRAIPKTVQCWLKEPPTWWPPGD